MVFLIHILDDIILDSGLPQWSNWLEIYSKLVPPTLNRELFHKVSDQRERVRTMVRKHRFV